MICNEGNTFGKCLGTEFSNQGDDKYLNTACYKHSILGDPVEDDMKCEGKT